MSDLSEHEQQALIWDYYKPRHTHAWNMLVLSWNALDQQETDIDFQTEYFWENFIVRLWLYRTTVRTLTQFAVAKVEATTALEVFDEAFNSHGLNCLKALRDMIEHFDDYAGGKGRGPAIRESDLDPWREITRDRYERGRFFLDREKSYGAAIELQHSAHRLSDAFIQWYQMLSAQAYG